MEPELRLVNVKLPLGSEGILYRLSVKDGVWVNIEVQEEEGTSDHFLPIEEWDGKAEQTIDLKGKILLPGFVDAHMHLDKAYSLPQVGNQSGTLLEAIENYSKSAPRFSKEEIKARMTRAALQAVSYGTTAIRTHLDFHVKHGAEVALRTVEAALEVKEDLKDYVEIQLFPIFPFNLLPDEAAEVVEESLRMGVTGVGGAPHLSPTPEKDIDVIFRLAEKYDRPIDLHTDESDDPQVKTIAYIAQKTMEYGWSGRVTAGHLCSLAAMSDEEANPLIEGMARAGISAVTLPGANLYLQGRYDSFPVRRGVTRVKGLLEAGIPLATASDNIHDPFHPFGRGDLLLIGLITAYAAHMGSPSNLRQLLTMMTENPAKILGLEGYGIRIGKDADFVVFDGKTPEELFTELPDRRWVWRKGRLLKSAGKKREWKDSHLTQLWEDSLERLDLNQRRRIKVM
ncbi:MAG: amidohydrolase family protein [Thermicanus sp.]|nr:amidohydrolase family protein [Thermicanus sp.]